MRSHSIGVSLRSFLVFGSSMTCVLRFNELSLVSIVRAGRSSGSGNAIAPSENVYLYPELEVLSIFFEPLR